MTVPAAELIMAATTNTEYERGWVRGFYQGQFDLTTHRALLSMRDNPLAVHHTRESRAYGIGFARGYREATSAASDEQIDRSFDAYR